MMVMYGSYERLNHTLYDSFRIVPNMKIACFQVPVGGYRTLADTNMETGGALPAGRIFVCLRIGIQLDPETDPADRAAFGRWCFVSFQIQSKPYWSGLASDLLFDDLVAAAVSKINRVTRGKSSSSYKRTLKDIAQSLRRRRVLGVLQDPATIEQCQAFSVSLSANGIQPLQLTSPEKGIAGRIVLEGYLFRRVQ
jgi:hypothetical protein